MAWNERNRPADSQILHSGFDIRDLDLKPERGTIDQSHQLAGDARIGGDIFGEVTDFGIVIVEIFCQLHDQLRDDADVFGFRHELAGGGGNQKPAMPSITHEIENRLANGLDPHFPRANQIDPQLGSCGSLAGIQVPDHDEDGPEKLFAKPLQDLQTRQKPTQMLFDDDGVDAVGVDIAAKLLGRCRPQHGQPLLFQSARQLRFFPLFGDEDGNDMITHVALSFRGETRDERQRRGCSYLIFVHIAGRSVIEFSAVRRFA